MKDVSDSSYAPYVQASAPPLQPTNDNPSHFYLYDQQQQQYHQQQQIPFARPIPVDYDDYPHIRSRNDPSNTRRSLLYSTLKMIVFHLLNYCLGVIGFCVVIFGVTLSAGLLPLCCAGVLVFRLLMSIIPLLAEMDITLHNFIATVDEQIYVGLPRHRFALSGSLEGSRLSPELFTFSRSTVIAILYFLTIKFGVGIFSIVSLSLAFSFPLNAISSEDMREDFSGFSGTLVLVVLSLVLFVMGMTLMPFVARVSMTATKYFCAEKFTAYTHVRQHNAENRAVHMFYGATTV